MCLIIAPGRDGKAALLPRDAFDFAYPRNDDGLGGMYVEDGRVKHFKLLGMKKDEEYEFMQKMVEEHPDIIFHMRYKTHGVIIPSLCHPFRILHKNRHGRDLFFMHNGILGNFGKDLRYGQSDTTNFKDKILIPLLTRNPDALDDPEIFGAIEKMTVGSRLLFLDSNGKVYRTSASSWNERYGLTLSNTYMLPSEPYKYDSGWNKNVKKLPSPDKKGDGPYTLFRRIKYEGGAENHIWCREIKKGWLRSEHGLLFRDQGAGITLNFQRDYVPKDKEFEALLEDAERKDNKQHDLEDDNCDCAFCLEDKEDKALEEIGADKKDFIIANDDDLDDVPFPEGDKSAEAFQTERLRYARIVHNCHSGNVVSRTHLMGDILGMDDKELLSFITEDPETSAVVLAELFEIILDQNDVIEDPEGDFTFDMQTLHSRGSTENHKKSMEEISFLRRCAYESALKAKEAKETAEEDVADARLIR